MSPANAPWFKLETYSYSCDFKLMKEVFSIEDLCDLLKINRNRYNYLNRHSMLNWHIAKIGGFVYET